MGEYLIAFILGGVAGIAIGLIVARVGGSNSNSEVIDNLNQELDAVKEKLKQQTEHFAESENMLHKIGTDLKDLYQHMSKNEISTLKEKFKGLVIDADAPVDGIGHKVEEMVDGIKDVAEDAKDAVVEKVADVKETAENVKDKIVEKAADVKETAENVKDKVVAKATDVKEAAGEASTEIVDKVEDAKEKADDSVDQVIDDLKNAVAEKDKK